MTGDLVVAGPDGVLGSRLAAQAAATGRRVLTWAAGDALPAAGGGDLWWLAGPRPTAADARAAAGLVAAAAPTTVTVVAGGGVPAAGVAAAARTVLAAARGAGAATSTVLVPTLVSADRTPAGRPRVWLPERLLAVVHMLVGLLGERQPDYLRHRPLRWVVPAAVDGARPVPLLGVAAAAEALLALPPAPDGSRRRLAPEATWSLADLCHRIGDLWGLALLPAGADADLTPVDRLLTRLVGEPEPPAPPARDARPVGDGGRAVEAALRSLYAAYERDRTAVTARAATLPGRLTKRLVREGPAAATLTYRVVGSLTPPVVFLNAIGQGGGYWHRLLAALAPRRLLIWDVRAAADSVDEQVADVEAVLRSEGIDRCHLVGWCTGAKVAVRLADRQPDLVRSIVLLNASFRSTAGGPFDTAYEGQLAQLCDLVTERPRLAKRMLPMMRAGSFGEPRPLTGPDDELVAGVLAAPAAALRADLRRPFADEAAVAAYVRQIRRYWACDVSEAIGRLRAPVLFVSGDEDRIVSEAAQRDAAAAFPHAEVATIPGGTHYLMYDRAAEVAALVAEFVGRDRGR